MLKHLKIRNYALIKELEFSPSTRLNTITGETGAGKSIMLGAIGLLLGNRADTKALLNPDEKCIVEGVFNIEEYNLKDFFIASDLDYYPECIIRREISPSGKSRAFINDTPVTLDTAKEIGMYLVDIHSQTDTRLLGNASYQMQLIDSFTDSIDLLSKYRESYRSYKKALKTYEELENQSIEIKSEADYHHFLFEELDKAALQENEQTTLEEEQKILEHSEEIKRKLLESIHLVNENEFSVLQSLQVVTKNIGQISQYSQNYHKLSERLNSVMIELKDINNELEGEEQRIEFDPLRQDEVSERLSLLYKLEQKHQVEAVADLLKIKDSLEERLHIVSNIDESVARAKKDCENLLEQTIDLGKQLSDKRKKGFEPLKSKLKSILSDLGMEHASIDLLSEEVKPTDNGIDEIKILFSANLGIKPEELRKVASGGEFSRLMFAIKNIIAEKTSLPTIIFDEIDSGISGEIAIKMASLMKKMATHHQVVTITHLPQIASKGDFHFFVFKDNSEFHTVSRIRKLNEEERVLEIAKMIGGDKPTETNLNSARELLTI